MSKISIYADGGCKNNQGDVSTRQAYGSYLVCYNFQEQRRSTMVFEKAKTNNEAEYGALLGAMQYISGLKARAVNSLPDIEIVMDSQLVLTQVAGTAKVKAAGLKPLHAAAMAWIEQNPSVEFRQISGEEMKEILGH